ncbi:MAG: HAD-IA family hydrolase [Sphaerochaeta sp.]|jgi:putative hydrolase of the HAD superfamily|nr:HAD-IA family hydrolase [Sphaerochaeta sp.]MDX9915763.1 HAD-IA family hydrolase [Sphaerochaeta sp.]
MYDIIATDLKRDHPLIDGLPHLVALPIQGSGTHLGRILAVSGSEDRLIEAEEAGMGSLLADDACTRRDVLLQMSWYDDPLPEHLALVLFDLGGVVVKNITMLGKIARRYALEREQFFTDYRHYEFPLMEGAISEEQYWQRAAEHFGIDVTGNPFLDAFEPVVNDEMVRLIAKLRSSGVRVVCASNTIDSHWNILKGMGVLDLFDATYASHILGCAKPKKRFHHLILDAEAVDGAQAYFIDDSETNVMAARRMGLASLLYADVPGARASERLASAFALLR